MSLLEVQHLGNCIRIPFNYHGKRIWASFDADDEQRIRQWVGRKRLGYRRGGYDGDRNHIYPSVYMGHGSIPICRLLLGVSGGDQQVDHVDGNTLNNRRSNLRRATSQQNAFNQCKRQGCTSRFKGVFWRKNRSRWCAMLCLGYRNIYLGSFTEESDAARAYNIAACTYFGEFARINDLEATHGT